MTQSKQLDKHYQPADIEQNHYQQWESNGYFKAAAHNDSASNSESYTIMIPPPNVTGTLHMGHAFQDTIMDILIRYHRMAGYNTLWQPGTDHAGIATQMVVERQLNAKGQTRHDLGREAFVEKVWEWKAESGGAIANQLKRMGASADWSRERFTMDEGLSEAVRTVFVKLYNEKQIYRGKRLVNWDPVLQTAVSDLEVISEEENGQIWHIKYPLTSGDGFLTVATTRPETMLGDVAVAVHPDDERYQHLIGQQLELPLTGRTIPVIADEYVDPEFGSGCVKITPAHDFNDYEVGERHNLEKINIFNDTAHINLQGSPYHGMDRNESRKAVLKDLEELGLIEAVKDHKLMVPRGDRTNSVIEPYLTDQWFVDVEQMAAQAREVVESGEIRFVPDNWKNTYFEWMNNIKDWCISRQLWWGHRIPAWYDEAGNIYVAENETDAYKQARESTGNDAITLTQDEDVLDTWFSSALWPFSTLGWPQENDAMKTYYPTSVLVTGFDIIFFWVARMIMFGKTFTGEIPFHEVYIHGLVRDQDGQKMSKSKGNVLDPIDLIDGISLDDLLKKRTAGMMQPHLREKIEAATRKQFPDGIPAFGTDALRFTFASLATLGRDVRFDLSRIEGNRNFCNKLWNAARFVMMNAEGKDCGQHSKNFELGEDELWLISETQKVTQKAEEAIRTYRFDILAQNLYQFIWDKYCSWYLEMAKVTLNNDDVSESRKTGTRHTLVNTLETLLRLIHPVMPYISEEIWQKVKPYSSGVEAIESIMIAPYPQADESLVHPQAVESVNWMQSFVSALRNLKSEKNIEPSKRLNVYIQGMKDNDSELLSRHKNMILKLARLDSVQPVTDDIAINQCASAISQHLTLLVPLGDLIDVDAEKARLNREMDKLQKDIDKVNAMINNPGFLERAPEAVVKKNKADLQNLLETQQQIENQLNQLAQM